MDLTQNQVKQPEYLRNLYRVQSNHSAQPAARASKGRKAAKKGAVEMSLPTMSAMQAMVEALNKAQQCNSEAEINTSKSIEVIVNKLNEYMQKMQQRLDMVQKITQAISDPSHGKHEYSDVSKLTKFKNWFKEHGKDVSDSQIKGWFKEHMPKGEVSDALLRHMIRDNDKDIGPDNPHNLNDDEIDHAATRADISSDKRDEATSIWSDRPLKKDTNYYILTHYKTDGTEVKSGEKSAYDTYFHQGTSDQIISNSVGMQQNEYSMVNTEVQNTEQGMQHNEQTGQTAVKNTAQAVQGINQLGSSIVTSIVNALSSLLQGIG